MPKVQIELSVVPPRGQGKFLPVPYKGGIVAFGNRLFRVSPFNNTSTEVTDTSILARSGWARCVPHWAHRLLRRGSSPITMEAVSEQMSATFVDTAEVWCSPSVGGRTVVLVVKGGALLADAEVFHLYKDGRIIRPERRSSAQASTREGITLKGWKQGDIKDDQFSGIRQVLESSKTRTQNQKAA